MASDEILYNERLGNEWIDWVEGENLTGTRAQEIFPLITQWLADKKPASVLDIGCGQGICSTLVSSEMKYVGVDPSLVLIKRAEELYSSGNKKFIEGDALELTFKNNSFDATMSIWVWSHLKDLAQAAREMQRVLKTNGSFLIVTANPDTYEERKTFYTSYEEKDGLLTGTFDLENGKSLSNSTLYLHSREFIEKSIAEAGLEIDSLTHVGQLEKYLKGLYIAIKGHKNS
jgi:ubiquinone/menaquinone biosynthesis C-methylase UbiE